jgi:hypothetical protein
MVILFKEIAMELVGDTFLLAVYVIVDEFYQREIAPLTPRRPGPRPRPSDSELLTLLLVAQYEPTRSERAVLRYAQTHWADAFPQLPSQSTFNRRGRKLEPVVATLGPRLAQDLATLTGDGDRIEVLDGTPVPLMRKCRGVRHKCFGDEAALGCGGSDRDWYYGLELMGAVSASGAITGAVLAPANTEERFSVEALLGWRLDASRPVPTAGALEPILGKPHRQARQGPTGPLAGPLMAGAPASGLYMGDRGLRGRAWHQHWHDDFGATVLTPADLPQPVTTDAADWHASRLLRRWLRQARQVAERAFGMVIALFGLSFPRAKTYQGVRTRVAAKLAAYNLQLLLNHLFHRPPFAHFNPFL